MTVAAARFASLILVPGYDEVPTGLPFSAYAPRTRRSTIIGAPVSTTWVPAAGVWAMTRFEAYPYTGPVRCQAKPASSRIPLAKT